MLELFLQQLPTSVQSILVSFSLLTLPKEAEVTDRILEVNPMPISASSVTTDSNAETSKLSSEFEKLHKHIDKLQFYHKQRS
ncbi:hypothetical protein CEXT_587361 [Caerostris extrusa]|uniref:Uncharacterized protein n=1 Tax=Caerostris extrusa TaxID=172846 RepID=A0AAV4UCQ0_CAEEX|nr:hypothetical protein CEXT_587361 [Caerostris extrusa]